MGYPDKEFSWSNSRRNLFEECERKYWFNYYGSWGGWNFDAPQRTKDAYMLKNLKNRYTWSGTIVHETIEDIILDIKNRQPIPKEQDIISQLEKRFIREIKESENKDYLQSAKKYNGLVEHHYEDQLDEEEWDKILDNTRTCISNLYKSNIFKTITALDPDKITIPEKFSHFYFEGTKIFAIPDLMYKEDGHTNIIDWKTGKYKPQDNQIIIYSLYANYKYNIPFEKIKPSLFFLQEMKSYEIEITQDMIEDLKQKIRSSISSMKSKLIDQEKDIAKEEQNFARNTSKCYGCNYRAICN